MDTASFLQNDDTSQFYKRKNQPVPFVLFGFGYCLAYQWMLYSTSIIYPLANKGHGFLDYDRAFASLIVIAILCIFLFFLSTRAQGDTRNAYILSALSGAAAIALLALFGNNSTVVSDVLTAVGWGLYGICTPLIIYLWLKVYALSNAREVCQYVAGALILAAIIVYVLCYLPTLVSCIVTGLLPAASIASSYYAKQSKLPSDGDMPALGPAKDAPKILSRDEIRLLVSIFIYTVVYSALINPLATRSGNGYEAGSMFMLLAPLLVGLLIAALVWFTPHFDNLSTIFRITLPIIVATLLAFPFFQGLSLNVAGLVGAWGFDLFNYTALAVVVDMAHRAGQSTVSALIRNRIVYLLGMLIGFVCSAYLSYFELYKDKDLFLVLCFVSVIILVFVASTLLFSGNSESFSSAPKAPANAPADEESPTASIPGPEEIFEYKANQIVNRFGLTPREKDVFILLSKGRSNKLIMERLVISEHTVDSHVTHIYRKCNVHSRQEIMDLIEQERVDMSSFTDSSANVQQSRGD